jgi:Lecithin:cholesterol acyltransferase/Carboxypeptidase regulatory-like domain/Bacterial TSP3 repeat
VNLTSGTVTAAVTLDTAGRGVQLHVSGGGATGTSNSFDVTAGTPAVGRLSGSVTLQSTDTPTVGATVILTGAQGTSTTSSGSGGLYAFPNTPSGQYTLRAIDPVTGYHSTTLNLQVVAGAIRFQPIVLSDCNPLGLTPVLLVPGILGSSLPEGDIMPHLPKDSPSWDDSRWAGWKEFLPLHNPGGLFEVSNYPGWRALVTTLRTVNAGYKVGCTVFPVPYDWRKPVDEIATGYLAPAIAHAKEVAGTTSVNIIAHSMGGLVTRSYIQGSAYENDVKRFAMVGTPNHGAPFAYYFWQGSDPENPAVRGLLYNWALDDLSWTLQNRSLQICTQSDTAGSTTQECRFDRQRVFELLHGHVRSVRDLQPTGAQALDPNGALSCEPSGEWTNQFLTELNESSSVMRLNDISSVYAGIRDPLFHGTNTTLGTLAVGPRQCIQAFYPDGTPKIDQTKVSGDETVSLTSASLPGINTTTQNAAHSSLIFAHRADLTELVAAGEPGTNLADLSFAEEAAEGTSSRELAVSLLGRTKLYLRAPDQTASGVVPESGIEIIEIPGSQISVRPDAAAVRVLDPADGSYQIGLSGSYFEDYMLRITYVDELGNSTQIEGIRFFSGSVDLTFTLEAGGNPVLLLDDAPSSPSGLQASIVTATSQTRLSWIASSDPQVVGYKVYSRLANMPYLTLVTTTTGTSIDTSDPWAGDSDAAVRIYAVSAFYQNGSESFLSRQVENNDRDHDGLSDAREPALGTDIGDPDSDHDGLGDGEEVGQGTNPLEVDSDHDGYSDLSEIQAGGDPLDPNRGSSLGFFTLTPCRLVDTRLTSALLSGVDQQFGLIDACGVPSTARALSVNITVVGATGSGYINLSPVKSIQASTSNVNFNAGQTRANSAIIALAPDSSGTSVAHAFVSGSSGQVDLIIDVNGYFAAEAALSEYVGLWIGTIAGYSSELEIGRTGSEFTVLVRMEGANQPEEQLSVIAVSGDEMRLYRPDDDAELRLSLQAGQPRCLIGEYLEPGTSRPISLCRQ